jgi:PKD repeat protein
VADFTGSPTSGDAPLNVDFTDTSLYTPTSWSWDFGDTGSSTVQNPSHTYTTPNTYTVSLTATNAGGSDSETKVDYITATVQTPVADFTGSPTTGYAPLSVDFTDTSLYVPTSWSWDFGDTGTSTAQNPSHTYTSPNTYTVSLTATNAAGSDSETKVDYISVTTAPDATILLEVHPNERGQGPSGGPRIGTGPWQPASLVSGAWYQWKVYEFEGSADLWIQVSAQCFGKAQTGQAENDRLLMSIDGSTPPDVWGLQSGPSGTGFDYQWNGAVDLGQRLTLEFQPAGLVAGKHEIKFKADATPVLWWIKVYDLSAP